MTENTPVSLPVDIRTIQRILPHRYPFLLVDRITELEPLKRAVGIKNVTFNEPHFQGHFPEEPVMPGVLIIEALAQTGGLMVGFGVDAIDQNLMVYFMGVDKCKFRRKVVPGDQLRLEIETLRGRKGGKVWRFQARALVEDELAAEAELTAMMVPAESEA